MRNVSRLLAGTAILLTSQLIESRVFAADNSAFEEIVVTARKREETLQTVPVAVSAFTGNNLEAAGLSNTQDLFSIAPGIYFSQTGQRTNEEQFYLMIRGVGASPVVEPSVGVFVDGVYMPSLGWSMEFMDLERIEILRGPQGALFGRNTQAGALNVISKKPGDIFTGKVAVEGGSFGTYKGAVSVSGPLSSNFFAGISAFATHTDGFVDNVTRGENQDNRNKRGGRLILRALPSDTSEIVFSTDYTKIDGRFDAFGDATSALVYRVVDPTAPATGTFTESHALAGQRYTTFGNQEQTVDVESYGMSLNVTVDIDFAELTSISGYRHVRSTDIFDIDGIGTASSSNAATTEQVIASEELRLASNDDGKLSWIFGLYAFTEKLKQSRLSSLDAGIVAALIQPGFVSDDVEIDRDGVAAFGQISYAMTDKLNLTMGARYSYENVHQTPDLLVDLVVPTPGGPVAITTVNNVEQKKSFDGFSPMGSVSYEWTDDVMTYASISTGFKGGGFTKEVPNSPAQNMAVANETSLNYEIGIKARFADNRMLLNAAAFRSDLKNQQLSTRFEVAPGVFAPTTTNAGKGHTQGFEAELMAQPVDGLVLKGSVTYTDSEFDEYIAVPAVGAAPAYDRSGQSFPEVPKWMGSATAAYRIDVPDAAISITPSATWRYIGKKFIGEGNASIPFLDIPSYNIVDAQISVEADQWSITAYARNLFDKYYIVNRFLPQPVLSVPGNRAFEKPGAPRQIGVRASYNF